MDYCVKCMYWNQAEEKCSLEELCEYDPEEFVYFCDALQEYKL